MKISKNMWNHAWKIVLTVALAVGGYFGFTPNPQDAQKPEQQKSTSSTSATGIEGGVRINNNIYPLQSPATKPVAQPAAKNSIGFSVPILNRQKKLVSQNNTQEMGNANNNSPQINGDDNKVDISSERNEIEEQTNIERNTKTGEGSQYIENPGSDNTFCSGNDDTACSNDGTIHNNPAK
jgi:hypothetical protein